MPEGFEHIGQISKAHGLNGEVIISPTVANPEQLTSISIFYVLNNRGDIEPLRVESSKVVEKNNRFSFFVKFVNLTERSHAEKLRKKEVMIPVYEYENLDQFEFSYHECVEWEVVDESDNHVGKILDVMENPAHELLEVKSANGRFFIPCVEEYIQEVDDINQKIVVKNYEPLLEV